MPDDQWTWQCWQSDIWPLWIMYSQATSTDVFSVLCQIGRLCIICIADQNILGCIIQTNKQTNIQTNKHTKKQAYKQTYKPSLMYSRTLHPLWMFAVVRQDPQVHQRGSATKHLFSFWMLTRSKNIYSCAIFPGENTLA